MEKTFQELEEWKKDNSITENNFKTYSQNFRRDRATSIPTSARDRRSRRPNKHVIYEFHILTSEIIKSIRTFCLFYLHPPTFYIVAYIKIT